MLRGYAGLECVHLSENNAKEKEIELSRTDTSTRPLHVPTQTASQHPIRPEHFANMTLYMYGISGTLLLMCNIYYT